MADSGTPSTSESDHIDGAALLARLAANPASIERICNTLQRAGLPATDHGVIRRALRAAAEELRTPPGSQIAGDRS